MTIHPRSGDLLYTPVVIATTGSSQNLPLPSPPLPSPPLPSPPPAQAVSKDAEAFLQEAEGCVQKGHYEAASLSVLARALKEKLAAVSKMMVDKLRITRASAEFHQNVKKVSRRGDQSSLMPRPHAFKLTSRKMLVRG